MYCIKCGNKLPEGSEFCNKCGHRIVQVESQEESQVKIKSEADQVEIQVESEKETNQEPQEAPKSAVSQGTTESTESTETQESTPPQTREKPKKPKKSKKALVTILTTLILIAVLIFALKDTLAYSLFPEQYIVASIGKTFKAVNNDLEKTQTIFLGDTSKRSTTNNLKAVITNAGASEFWLNESLAIFSGMGFEIKSATDFKDKSIYLGATAIYDGRDFASLDLKLDDNELLVRLPELYHKAFSLPSRNFGKEWNQSAFAQEGNMYLDESLDISFSELMKDVDIIEMDKQTKMDYLNSFKTLTKNASYTKDGNEEFLIGDRSKKVKKTSVALVSDDIKSGLIELIESIENDNRIQQWKDNLKATNQAYAVYEIEESLSYFKNEMQGFSDLDRVVFDVYTNKGKAVKIDLEITPNHDYMNETLKLSLGFLGEKNLSDDIIFELIVGQNDGKMIFTSKNDQRAKKNEIINQTQFLVYDYGQEMLRLDSSAKIDLSSKKDNLTYSLDILIPYEMKVDIRAKGDFQSSSKNIEYNLHDLSFAMEEPYYDERINFAGSLFLSSIDGIKDIPKIQEGEKIKVLELLEYDFFEISETLRINMMNLVDSLGLY